MSCQIELVYTIRSLISSRDHDHLIFSCLPYIHLERSLELKLEMCTGAYNLFLINSIFFKSRNHKYPSFSHLSNFGYPFESKSVFIQNFGKATRRSPFLRQPQATSQWWLIVYDLLANPTAAFRVFY